MTVQAVAILLLISRIVSLVFAGLVVKRQHRLFELHIDSELVAFRVVMFMLGIVFVIGSIFPMYVDIYYGFIDVRATWNSVIVLYAVSNATVALVASILLWNIYRIAGTELDERQEREDLEVSNEG